MERTALSRYQQDLFCEELDEIVVESVVIGPRSSEAIIPWLTGVYKDSRGFELGTFDASLLPIVWKKLSTNWDVLTLGYVSDIVEIMHGFTMKLLQVICHDERVASEALNILME